VACPEFCRRHAFVAGIRGVPCGLTRAAASRLAGLRQNQLGPIRCWKMEMGEALGPWRGE
jgi:hypothetical protein